MRRRRTRFLLRGIFLSILALGLIWGSHHLLHHLELFALKNIQVLGNSRTIKSAQIIKRSRVQKGINLFEVDLESVHGRLKGHDFFKKVSVRRRLPNTLVIEIQEYEPHFVLMTPRQYYVDDHGEIFKDITDTDDQRDFPVLSGLSEDTLLMNPQRAKEILIQAIKLELAYQKSEFASRYGLSEIHYEKNIGFTLYPEMKKYSIKFGNKDFVNKTKKLAQVLDQMKDSKVKISSIDLNYRGKVLMTL